MVQLFPLDMTLTLMKSLGGGQVFFKLLHRRTSKTHTARENTCNRNHRESECVVKLSNKTWIYHVSSFIFTTNHTRETHTEHQGEHTGQVQTPTVCVLVFHVSASSHTNCTTTVRAAECGAPWRLRGVTTSRTNIRPLCKDKDEDELPDSSNTSSRCAS